MGGAELKMRGCWMGACAAAAAALALGGCALQESRRAVRAMHESGDYGRAYEFLGEERSRRLYEEKSGLVWLLDRGALELALDRPAACVATLTEAEARMESGRETTLGDEIARWLVNDEQAEYRGSVYEDLYTNVLKLAAQLEAGNIAGGATVEARRMAIKANALRDRYLKLRPAAEREAESRGATRGEGALAGIASLDSEGQFVESPLGLFLSALAFLFSGDPSDQGVAGRRLLEMIGAQGDIIGPVDVAPFERVGELSTEEVNVAVVAFSGAGPRKVPFRLPPLVIEETPVYLELPVVEWSEPETVEVRVEARAAGSESAGESRPLHFIESMGSVARENFRRELPAIYFRTLARAAAKSFGLTLGAQAAENAAHDDAAGFAVALGGLALLLATERADVRCWEFLPGQAHVGLLNLAEGAHEVRVEYLSAGGVVLFAGPWRRVEATRGGLTTIVEHFWR